MACCQAKQPSHWTVKPSSSSMPQIQRMRALSSPIQCAGAAPGSVDEWREGPATALVVLALRFRFGLVVVVVDVDASGLGAEGVGSPVGEEGAREGGAGARDTVAGESEGGVLG